MAKITRAIQKIFGSAAGINQRAQIGSLAAGTPNFTTDPAVIQGLANYLEGWFGVVLGGNSPAIEDMNSLCFLFAYQLAYLMQAGIAEWETGTTYYKGSFVNVGGVSYISLTDNNLGNAVTSSTNWTTAVKTNSFLLEDATVPYVNIGGPSYQSVPLSLTSVLITLFNSGTSGSTTIKLNQYRAGALFASATAALPASSGNPAGAVCALSGTLTILAGDIVTVDVVSVALGEPESLKVTF